MRSRDLEDNIQDFLRIADQFHEKLVDGWDVLVHCTYSFHRGPICLAGLVRRTTGTPVRVSVRFQQYGAQPRPTPCIAERSERGPGARSLVCQITVSVGAYILPLTRDVLHITCYIG